MQLVNNKQGGPREATKRKRTGLQPGHQEIQVQTNRFSQEEMEQTELYLSVEQLRMRAELTSSVELDIKDDASAVQQGRRHPIVLADAWLFLALGAPSAAPPAAPPEPAPRE